MTTKNPYTVIAYRPFPQLSVTDYALEDGTRVRFIDDCLFEIESTGMQIDPVSVMPALVIWGLLVAAILGVIGIASFG